MKELVEKILERLDKIDPQEMMTEEQKNVLNFAKEIVQEVAEEYKGGWIPCIERLPYDDSICIVTVEYPNNEIVVDYGWFDRIGVCWYVGMQEFRTSNVLAWQPLPEQYEEH